MPTQSTNQLLDRFIPLRNANHADVLRYSIEIPLRYCECSAALTDGRRSPLLRPRAFVGWSCKGRERRYLFRNENKFLELGVTTGESGSRDMPVHLGKVSVRQVDQAQIVPMPQGCGNRRTFTGIDGGLFVLDPAEGAVDGTLADQAQGDDNDWRFLVTAG